MKWFELKCRLLKNNVWKFWNGCRTRAARSSGKPGPRLFRDHPKRSTRITRTMKWNTRLRRKPTTPSRPIDSPRPISSWPSSKRKTPTSTSRKRGTIRIKSPHQLLRPPALPVKCEAIPPRYFCDGTWFSKYYRTISKTCWWYWVFCCCYDSILFACSPRSMNYVTFFEWLILVCIEAGHPFVDFSFCPNVFVKCCGFEFSDLSFNKKLDVFQFHWKWVFWTVSFLFCLFLGFYWVFMFSTGFDSVLPSFAELQEP